MLSSGSWLLLVEKRRCRKEARDKQLCPYAGKLEHVGSNLAPCGYALGVGGPLCKKET